MLSKKKQIDLNNEPRKIPHFWFNLHFQYLSILEVKNIDEIRENFINKREINYRCPSSFGWPTNQKAVFLKFRIFDSIREADF